ncbi:MAG: FKBP-type peptidyl-prolyl cis-trans isomerase [Lachnospiraceae bacterium]|nr:FKBP-type peptidyl-prolyl cis-trans isomerase [Lachnospiraceae bacterium]
MAKDKKKVNENTDISKSKAKREERRKEVAKSKRSRMISRVISTVILVAIAGVILFFAGKSIYLSIIRTKPNTDMSAGLTADGKISGVNVLDALTLADYENITISEEDVSTDEQVQDDIDEILEEYKEIDYDVSLEIADGDEVNIDYVGTIDGVEFEGGNSNNAGYDLTIGSGSFIDDFEQQLIGTHPGDDVTVEVTFPDDYGDDEVSGKDAVFAVTVNGIYKAPAFNDEFLEKNGLISDEITTADEYRASLAKNYYEENLRSFLSNYIIENSTVNSYPKDYVKYTKATTKANDEAMANYYSQMFASSGMMASTNVWEFTGDEDEFAYEKSLSERANDSVKEDMIYQAIFEKAGLTIDMEAVKAEMNETNDDETYADSMVASYGEGYLAKSEMHDVVLDYLVDLYKEADTDTNTDTDTEAETEVSSETESETTAE